MVKERLTGQHRVPSRAVRVAEGEHGAEPFVSPMLVLVRENRGARASAPAVAGLPGGVEETSSRGARAKAKM